MCSAAGPWVRVVSGCFIDSLELDLGLGDNVVFLKGGDGTGFATLRSVGPRTLPDGFVTSPVPVGIFTGSGNDTIIGSECSDFIQPGGGNDFVDGNGPDISIACAIQDDILATWGFFPFGGSPVDFPFPVADFGCEVSGDIIDLSSLDGPATITINEDGSVTITGHPRCVRRHRACHRYEGQRHAQRQLPEQLPGRRRW